MHQWLFSKLNLDVSYKDPAIHANMCTKIKQDWRQKQEIWATPVTTKQLAI